MSDKAVTFDNQISELKRELAMRERLYPNWIDKGTLNRDQADTQLARLRATLHTLLELQESHTEVPSPIFRLRTEGGVP